MKKKKYIYNNKIYGKKITLKLFKITYKNKI